MSRSEQAVFGLQGFMRPVLVCSNELHSHGSRSALEVTELAFLSFLFEVGSAAIDPGLSLRKHAVDHTALDGQDISGQMISVPQTNGWQSWQTLDVPGIRLPGGVHTLQMVMHRRLLQHHRQLQLVLARLIVPACSSQRAAGRTSYVSPILGNWHQLLSKEPRYSEYRINSCAVL